jgi:guanylate kinase
MEYNKKYNLHKVVSTTTRYPRIKETCGYDYYYMPKNTLCDAKGE